VRREARGASREARREARGGKRLRAERAAKDPSTEKRGGEKRWTAVLYALAIVGLTIAVYAPVRHFELVNWDDPNYISENPVVLGGLSWSRVRWAFTTTHAPYWHPMTWISLLTDVSLYGRDAGGYHVTSLIIHVCTSVLLFLLLRRMTRATGRSAFVAAIFAIHPLHVESVAWIAERKDVLSTLFWALTIWAYVAYAAKPDWRRYLGVVALYGLALMSKPMVVTLPVVLLLLDWWPLRRFAGPDHFRQGYTPPSIDAAVGPVFRPAGAGRLVLEKLPLFAMAAAETVATMIVQRRVGAVAGLQALPLGARVANGTVSYVVYIWKTIWPTHLAAFYPFHAYPVWMLAAAAAALAAATAGAFAVRDRAPFVFVGWLWYLVTLAPVIGLTQAGEQARADRFMYVPMIGLLIAAAWLTAQVSGLRRLRAHGSWIAVALVIGYAVPARAQVETWADGPTLWRHAMAVVPGNYIAYQDLGEALRDRGQLDEALANIRQAFAYVPPNSPGLIAMLHNDAGLVLARQDKTDDAAKEFGDAVRLSPNFAEAHNNLGDALATEGRLADAAEHFQIAADLKPDFVEAQVGLGSTLLKQGRAAEAIPHYKAALALNSELAEAHDGLGAALAMLGKGDEAMPEYNEALRLRPDLPTAHLNIAVLLIQRGQIEDARRHLLTALSIDPGYEPARQLLAKLR
jgi:tetratricopeptide (TPR) repeat protein